MTKEEKRDQAAYREIGIRKVIEKILTGDDLSGYHGSTVAAARRRIASKKPALPCNLTTKEGQSCAVLKWLKGPLVLVMLADNTTTTTESIS